MVGSKVGSWTFRRSDEEDGTFLFCGVGRNVELSSCSGCDQKVCTFERNLQDPLFSSKGGEESVQT